MTNNLPFQEVQKEFIRYSQSTISKTFSDGTTSVETWTDALPYNVPLTVAALPNGEYLSLDNRRLFSAKKYSPNLTTPCIVYQSSDMPTDLMVDCGIDQLQLIWRDNSGLPQLHRLKFQANTIAGVLMIRCATQDSAFPLAGQLQSDSALDKRAFDPKLYKIEPAKDCFQECTDSHQESFQTATEVFIRIDNSHNSYHERTDLRDFIVNNPNHFEILKYERCTANLKARGENNNNIWDDWDELLLSISEAESCTRDEYEEELLKSLGIYLRTLSI